MFLVACGGGNNPDEAYNFSNLPSAPVNIDTSFGDDGGDDLEYDGYEDDYEYDDTIVIAAPTTPNKTVPKKPVIGPGTI